MKKEEWKPIEGYEGIYEISNMGHIRSHDRYLPKVVRGTPCISFYKGCVLSPGDNGHGYLFVYLRLNGNIKRFYIHRLVASHFLPKIEGKDFINHKDGDKTNNNVENLEWCTIAENNLHKFRVIKHFTSLSGKPNQKNRKKIGYFKNGILVETFNGLREASTKLNINYTNLSMICNGKRKSTLDIRII